MSSAHATDRMADGDVIGPMFNGEFDDSLRGIRGGRCIVSGLASLSENPPCPLFTRESLSFLPPQFSARSKADRSHSSHVGCWAQDKQWVF